jgi:hypothetical protein
VAVLVATGCGDERPTVTEACAAVAVPGVLEPLGTEGIGIFTADRHLEVDWPDGYSALSVGGRLSLVDPGGQVLAGVGDRVELTGREVRPGVLVACGTAILRVVAGPS